MTRKHIGTGNLDESPSLDPGTGQRTDGGVFDPADHNQGDLDNVKNDPATPGAIGGPPAKSPTHELDGLEDPAPKTAPDQAVALHSASEAGAPPDDTPKVKATGLKTTPPRLPAANPQVTAAPDTTLERHTAVQPSPHARPEQSQNSASTVEAVQAALAAADPATVTK